MAVSPTGSKADQVSFLASPTPILRLRSPSGLTEASSASDCPMTKDPFGSGVKKQIKEASGGRCICCMRELGDSGQCAHILDSSDRGSLMLEYAHDRGLLPPTYQCSSSQNGLLMCSSCHLDLFTPGLAILSPTHQVLQYLIDCVEADIETPIYEILQQLFAEEDNPNLPDTTHIKPYLDLYIVAALDPTKLQHLDVLIASDPPLSQLSDGVWTILPEAKKKKKNTASVTGKIYDANAIPPSARGRTGRLDFSQNEHYWRIPTQTAPILTYLLFQVFNLPQSNCQEIELAKLLAASLTRQLVLERGKRKWQDDNNNNGSSCRGKAGPSTKISKKTKLC